MQWILLVLAGVFEVALAIARFGLICYNLKNSMWREEWRIYEKQIMKISCVLM